MLPREEVELPGARSRARRPRSCSRGCSSTAATARGRRVHAPAARRRVGLPLPLGAAAQGAAPRVARASPRQSYEPVQLAEALGGLLRMPAAARPRAHGPAARDGRDAARPPALDPRRRARRFSFDEAVKGADRLTEAMTLWALLELYKSGEAALAAGRELRPDHGDGAMNELARIVEALLFLSSEPLDGRRDGRRLRGRRGRGRRGARAAARALRRGLARRRPARGRRAGSRSPPTRSPSAPRAGCSPRPRTPPLTQAQAECLAIVAYLQPVSRPEIARIRGVASESAVGTLLERGLIQESGRSQFGAVLYRTSDLFEKLFGLARPRRAARRRGVRSDARGGGHAARPAAEGRRAARRADAAGADCRASASTLDTLARWREFPALERLDEERVALTFDDGPDPDGTPAVLDALDAAGIKATFFMVGEQVKARARCSRARWPQRGHEIALHGATHRPHRELEPARLEGRAGVRARDARGRDRRAGRAGSARPTACSTSTPTRPCRAVGLEPVYWSAWGMDWETISAERILDIVERDLEPGAILVLHDSARYALPPRRVGHGRGDPADRGRRGGARPRARAPISGADRSPQKSSWERWLGFAILGWWTAAHGHCSACSPRSGVPRISSSRSGSRTSRRRWWCSCAPCSPALVLAPLAFQRGAMRGLRPLLWPIVLLAAVQVAVPVPPDQLGRGGDLLVARRDPGRVGADPDRAARRLHRPRGAAVGRRRVRDRHRDRRRRAAARRRRGRRLRRARRRPRGASWRASATRSAAST